MGDYITWRRPDWLASIRGFARTNASAAPSPEQGRVDYAAAIRTARKLFDGRVFPHHPYTA